MSTANEAYICKGHKAEVAAYHLLCDCELQLLCVCFLNTCVCLPVIKEQEVLL